MLRRLRESGLPRLSLMWGDKPEDQAAERRFHASQFLRLAKKDGRPPADVDAWLHLAVLYLLREIEVHHLCAAEMADGIEGIITTDD